MKVKLYVEGLNAWKSRRWITSKSCGKRDSEVAMGGVSM